MLWLLTVQAGLAHPFDSRLYGHHAQLRLDVGRVEVSYAVDVPKLDVLQEMDAAFPGGAPSSEDQRAFYEARRAELRDNLRLVVDGQPTPWQEAEPAKGSIEAHSLTYRLELAAAIPPDAQTLNLIDGNYPDVPSIFSAQVLVGPGVVVDDCSLVELAGGELKENRDGQWRVEEENRELRLSFRARGRAAAALRALSGGEWRPLGESLAATETSPLPALGAALLALALAAAGARSAIRRARAG